MLYHSIALHLQTLHCIEKVLVHRHAIGLYLIAVHFCLLNNVFCISVMTKQLNDNFKYDSSLQLKCVQTRQYEEIML